MPQRKARQVLRWHSLCDWYVDNLSFWLDLKIVGLTVRKIIVREGISQAGRTTMEEFRGRPDQGYNPDQ